MKRNRLVVFFLEVSVLLLLACKRDSVSNTGCVTHRYYVPAFQKQFLFKGGSYWVFTCTTNTHVDTMRCIGSSGSEWVGVPFVAHNTNPNACDSFEVYNITNIHMSFLGTDNAWFTLTSQNIILSANFYGNTSEIWALVDATAPDSVNCGGNTFYKLENKFDTLTVLGVRYNNVYQMHYSPNSFHFQRIWWCPGVGFVKFEFINLQNQVEIWQLKNYHVVF